MSKGKDCNGPKRPPGAYCLFVIEQCKKKTGSVPFGEMSKEISTKWRNMDENQRRKWFEKAAEARDKYKEEVARMKPVETRSRKIVKKPRTPYIFFTMEKRQQVVNECPRVQPQQIMKILARMWADLSPSEKGKYKRMAQLDSRRYLAERVATPRTRNAPRNLAHSSARRKAKKREKSPAQKVSSFFLRPFRSSSGSEILSSED